MAEKMSFEAEKGEPKEEAIKQIIYSALQDAFHRGSNPNGTLDQNLKDLEDLASQEAKKVLALYT